MLSLPIRTDNEHRAMRSAHDLVGHAAKDEAVDGRVRAPGHDDQVGAPGGRLPGDRRGDVPPWRLGDGRCGPQAVAPGHRQRIVGYGRGVGPVLRVEPAGPAHGRVVDPYVDQPHRAVGRAADARYDRQRTERVLRQADWHQDPAVRGTIAECGRIEVGNRYL